MASIDVGPGAIDRANSKDHGKTLVDFANPANKTGVINTVELWIQSGGASGVKVGTFYEGGSPNLLTCRSYATIGDVSGPGKRTISDLNIAVQQGDYLGVFYSAGIMAFHIEGGVKLCYYNSDKMSGGEWEYQCNDGFVISIFGTGIAIPTVITQAATEITDLSALGNGNIENDGGASITQHGVCWKAGSDPVNIAGSDDHTEEGAGSEGAFTSDMTGLSPATTYYYRAYATNSEGTSYGAAVSFLTETVEPTVTTQAATIIVHNGATLNGNITDDGGASITQHGFCWKAGADPVNIAGADGYSELGAGAEEAFDQAKTGLTETTLYYYRAYATNAEGTGYGAAQSFTTTEFRARGTII